MVNPDDCEVDFTLSLTEDQAKELHSELQEAVNEKEKRKFTFTVDPYFAPIALRELEDQIEVDE